MAKKNNSHDSDSSNSGKAPSFMEEQAAALELTKSKANSESLLAKKPLDPTLRLNAEEPLEHRTAKFNLKQHVEVEPPLEYIPAYENIGELPPSYGTRKLFLTSRDPHFLYAYWDLSHDQIAEGERSAHDGKVFLQLHRQGGDLLQQIQISPWSKEWYLHVNEANSAFYAEIGFYKPGGSFQVMTRSAQVSTPRDNLSTNTRIQFVTIPFDFSFQQLLELISHNLQEGEELATALARLQQEGFSFPFRVGDRSPLTESSQEELHEYMGGDIIRRTQAGSGEIIDILRKSWLSAQSSGQWVSSISSPFGSSFGQQMREFFMNVNAELIIYGGTAPDAKVKINGESVELKSDGTFHYHFNFKDGKFHIPVEATSADGEEMRSALLSFMRLSAYTEGVDKTSQLERIEPLGRL